MNKTLVIGLLLFLVSSFNAQAQYPYKWSVGGAMGLGAEMGYHEPEFTMSLAVGFNKVIKDTKWRWGIDAAIMNQGLADYFFDDDEPDRFVRSNYEYVGGIVDYSLFSKGGLNFFARGGLAPAYRRDMYVWHSENKYTCLGIIGIGSDCYFSRFTINGYIDPRGRFMVMLSYGWWFGKKMNRR